jgi:hypothetical protein
MLCICVIPQVMESVQHNIGIICYMFSGITCYKFCPYHCSWFEHCNNIRRVHLLVSLPFWVWEGEMYLFIFPSNKMENIACYRFCESSNIKMSHICSPI